MTIERKEELLTKPYWTYHDIMEYCDCGSTKAIQIKNQALREFGGSIRYLSQCVSVDSVMNCLKTTRDNEIEIIRKIKQEEVNEEESVN